MVQVNLRLSITWVQVPRNVISPPTPPHPETWHACRKMHEKRQFHPSHQTGYHICTYNRWPQPTSFQFSSVWWPCLASCPSELGNTHGNVSNHLLAGKIVQVRMWMMAWCFPVCVIVNSIIFKSYRDRRNTHTAKWVSDWEQLLRRLKFFCCNRTWRWEVPIFSHHQKIYMQWCIYRGYAHGFFHRQLRVYSIAKGGYFFCQSQGGCKKYSSFSTLMPWCWISKFAPEQWLVPLVSMHMAYALHVLNAPVFVITSTLSACLSLYHITHIRNFWSHGFMSCFAKTHLAPQKLLAHSGGSRMRASDVLLFLELIHVDTVS